MAQRIKKGDTVVVMRGREKGKTGEVIRVLREENRVIVKDVTCFCQEKKYFTKTSRKTAI